MSMPDDFFWGIKGARYSLDGKHVIGYTDSFEELQTVVNRHAQVGRRVAMAILQDKGVSVL